MGCDSLELTDKVRVIIVAYACLMMLALLNDYYYNVEYIYVYPMTFLSPDSSVDFFEVRTTSVDCPISIAHYRGSVMLVWDGGNIEARHLEHVHNVIYH